MSVKAKFTDDFLAGSKTIYNYNPRAFKAYLLYPQLIGFQRIGETYYNEVQYGNTYMLNYTTKGTGLFEMDSHVYQVREGDLIFIHNFFHHILKPIKNKPWEFYCIHIFEHEIPSKIYQSVVASQGFVLERFPSEKIVLPLQKMVSLLSEAEVDHDCEISIELYKMLLDISSEAESRARKPWNPAIDGAVNFIKENYDRPIRLDDILSKTTYSKNHVERLFKAQMNITIKEYLFYLRLLRSQELLVSSDLSLKEIASKVGLNEYRSLYRMYKKALGLSPEEYRMKAGRKENGEK